MTGWVLVVGVAALVAASLVRSWPRSGPASGLRRGLWLLAPAAVCNAAGWLPVVDDPLAGLLRVTAVLLVVSAVLRATPARDARSTREHVGEAVIAGLSVGILVATFVPVAVGPSTIGLALLAAEAGALWLLVLGRHEVRLQGSALRWLVAGGVVLSVGLRLGAGLLGWSGGHPVAAAESLLPALAWIGAITHPQARAPLTHITRGAPQLAGRQAVLVLVAALIGPGLAAGGPVLGLGPERLRISVVAGALTLLVVIHLVQLVERRGLHVWEAQHDTLTGLPTEPLFEDRLRQAIAGARRSGAALVVAFIDLDGFKEVNDTRGHEAGDEVLRRVASRLTAGVRGRDTVARRSGDEFLLLLADTHDPAVAEAVVERLMAELAEPMEIDGETHEVGASVGLAAWPHDGLDVEELVQHADEAMYEAKEAGRGQVCWYRSLGATRARLRLTLAQQLQTALREQAQLELDYEPLVDLRDGTVASFACRVRWCHPVLGRLTPSAFLPAATRSGLWRALDLEVLRLACSQARDWRLAGVLDVPLTVRLCDDHATSEELAGNVLSTLARFELPPQTLVVAVTEEALARGGEVFERTVDVLADHGVEVVLTGFGSADVGIFRLSHVRIAAVELATRIVRRCTGVEGPVVDTAVRLAEGLGLRVHAAGLDDEAQAEALRSRGCLVARGPALAPPVPAGVVDASLRSATDERRDGAAVTIGALHPADGHVEEVAPSDGLLSGALSGTDGILESDVDDLLRRVGEPAATVGRGHR